MPAAIDHDHYSIRDRYSNCDFGASFHVVCRDWSVPRYLLESAASYSHHLEVWF